MPEKKTIERAEKDKREGKSRKAARTREQRKSQPVSRKYRKAFQYNPD